MTKLVNQNVKNQNEKSISERKTLRRSVKAKPYNHLGMQPQHARISAI